MGANLPAWEGNCVKWRPWSATPNQSDIRICCNHLRVSKREKLQWVFQNWEPFTLNHCNYSLSKKTGKALHQLFQYLASMTGSLPAGPVKKQVERTRTKHPWAVTCFGKQKCMKSIEIRKKYEALVKHQRINLQNTGHHSGAAHKTHWASHWLRYSSLMKWFHSWPIFKSSTSHCRTLSFKAKNPIEGSTIHRNP